MRGLLHILRDKDDGVNCFVAGTVASLSFLFVQKERRRSLALYLFARAAQGMYNASKARGWFHFWGSSWQHGDSLLFVASSMWIMYAYIMRPESLPKSFWKFMVETAPIDKNILEAVRRNNRGISIDTEAVSKYIARATHNHGHVPLTANPLIVPCAILHPHTPWCSSQFLFSFRKAFSQTFPLYLSLTLVPSVVLHFKRFRRSPLTLLFDCTTSATRSTAFMATFVSSYMSLICLHRHMFNKDHRSLYAIAGAISSLSVLIERKSRRAELALYAMPRAADTLFFILRDRRWLVDVPYGLETLFALSMGMLLYLHYHERETLSPLLNHAFEVFLPSPSRRNKQKKQTQHKSQEQILQEDTVNESASQSS